VYTVDVVVRRVPHVTCMLPIACVYIRVYTGMNVVGQGSNGVRDACGGAECAS